MSRQNKSIVIWQFITILAIFHKKILMIAKKPFLGPIQLVVEAGKRNTKPLLLYLVKRQYSSARANKRSFSPHDVCHRTLLHNDLHDFGESINETE